MQRRYTFAIALLILASLALQLSVYSGLARFTASTISMAPAASHSAMMRPFPDCVGGGLPC